MREVNRADGLALSVQSGMAFLEAILPYGHVLLGGDYRPSAIAVGAAVDYKEAAEKVVDWAGENSWFLSKLRSMTGIPMKSGPTTSIPSYPDRTAPTAWFTSARDCPSKKRQCDIVGLKKT